MEHVKVFQGDQIGGCVTVISGMYQGEVHRIMIDYGASLPGSDTEKDFDYPWEEEPVDAVFFSHYHGDHAGRIMEIPPHIKLYMGPVARQAMINIQESLGSNPYISEEEAELHLAEAAVLKDRERVETFEWNREKRKCEPIDLPGFRIEPYSVDHSAYDAYMFLVEADDPGRTSGKYITVHTGDFRGHGRRGHRMLDVIDAYVHKFGKRKIDALVIEGTMMSRSNEKVLTEPQMQLEAAAYLSEHKYAFLVCSSTNVDSLASFYNAAQTAAFPYGRYMFVYNDYFMKQLKLYTKTAGAFSDVYKFRKTARLGLRKKLSHVKWDEPKSQKEFMEDYGFLAVIKPEKYHEHFIDEFLEAYNDQRIDQKPVIIYSMWDGYLKPRKPDGEVNKAFNRAWYDFFKKQEKKGIEVKYLHTSGHATPEMLANVINAIDPQDAIHPMHTENADGFKQLPIKRELLGRIR